MADIITHIRPANYADPICYAWQVCAPRDPGAIPVYTGPEAYISISAEMIGRTVDAVEGECEGLAIDATQAIAILAYAIGGETPSPQPSLSGLHAGPPERAVHGLSETSGEKEMVPSSSFRNSRFVSEDVGPSPEDHVAGAIAAFEAAHPEHYWHVAKGKVTAGEPLYGAIITDIIGRELGHGESNESAEAAFAIAVTAAGLATKEGSTDAG